MNLYVSDNFKSYGDTIVGYLEDLDTIDLILHIVLYWHACSENEYI